MQNAPIIQGLITVEEHLPSTYLQNGNGDSDDLNEGGGGCWDSQGWSGLQNHGW